MFTSLPPAASNTYQHKVNNLLTNFAVYWSNSLIYSRTQPHSVSASSSNASHWFGVNIYSAGSDNFIPNSALLTARNFPILPLTIRFYFESKQEVTGVIPKKVIPLDCWSLWINPEGGKSLKMGSVGDFYQRLTVLMKSSIVFFRLNGAYRFAKKMHNIGSAFQLKYELVNEIEESEQWQMLFEELKTPLGGLVVRRRVSDLNNLSDSCYECASDETLVPAVESWSRADVKELGRKVGMGGIESVYSSPGTINPGRIHDRNVYSSPGIFLPAYPDSTSWL